MSDRRAASVKRRGVELRNRKATSRYSVGLPSAIAKEVENYADNSDISVSQAISALVRLGLQSQEIRKRRFFEKLRKNLANHDPKLEDQMLDEFRDLILGR